MRTYSSLRGRIVETQSGRQLGKVRDLRARIGSDRPAVETLVVGRRGFFEHLGLGKREVQPGDAIPWEAVVRIEGKRIVVADGVEPV